MDILEIATNEAGGVGKLAPDFRIAPNVVSNWRLRKILPGPWALVLNMKYGKAIKAAKLKTFTRSNGEVVTDVHIPVSCDDPPKTCFNLRNSFAGTARQGFLRRYP